MEINVSQPFMYDLSENRTSVSSSEIKSFIGTKKEYKNEHEGGECVERLGGCEKRWGRGNKIKIHCIKK